MAFEIPGICFHVQDLDEYMALRKDTKFRKYGSAFRELIAHVPKIEESQRAFYRCLADTIETEELAKKVSGGMSLTTSTLGVSSLIPFVGTVTGAVAIATDAASRVAERVKDKKACWSIALEAARVLAKHRIAQMAAQSAESGK